MSTDKRMKKKALITLVIVVSLVAIVPVRKYVRSLLCRQPVLSVIDDPAGVVFWANPQVLSATDRERMATRSQRISKQEQRLREQQLRTIGYID